MREQLIVVVGVVERMRVVETFLGLGFSIVTRICLGAASRVPH